jgi:predicted GH43/DUF377 family glycosyl hydrolase
MKWRKLGRIYTPDTSVWWASKGYAHLPTAHVINDEIIRVYFSSLDENRYGRISYVELDIDKPNKIIRQAEHIVLDIGELGTFDDCGVTPSCAVTINERTYLYYIGWQRAERVPYMLFTGLAISEDKQNFNKYARVPILDRTDSDPFSRSAPFVLACGTGYDLWYWSCTHWTAEGNTAHYNNVIKHAHSTDGIRWVATDKICIEIDTDSEYALGRPWVVKDNGLYRMWYSARSKNGEPYRIGYAESADGLDWERKEHLAGITRSESGWDSEMICYPCVIDVKGYRYMFYNGNRHGESGFGCAILEES